MPTQKLMVGSNWTPVTTAADQKTIECINGYGVLWASSTPPSDSEYSGHTLTPGTSFVVTERVYARAATNSGSMVLIIT
jgi:hypothetical protein